MNEEEITIAREYSKCFGCSNIINKGEECDSCIIKIHCYNFPPIEIKDTSSASHELKEKKRNQRKERNINRSLKEERMASDWNISEDKR